MRDVHGGRKVESPGQPSGQPQAVADGRRAVGAPRRVQGFGGHVVLYQEGVGARNAGLERRRDAWMRQRGSDERLELGNEAMHPVVRQVEPEQLHRDDSAALVVAGTKHRAQNACADLMKNTKRSEGVCGRGTGNVRVQWKTPQGRRDDPSIEALWIQSFRPCDLAAEARSAC